MNNRVNVLCTVWFVAFATFAAQGQDRRERMEFGGKVGLNVSNVWDSRDDSFRADGKAGFVGGIFAGIPIGQYLGIQPELLYSQKGFRGSGTLLGNPYSFSRTTSYIDIPLQVQLKPASFLTLLAGPQFSYLLHQKDRYTFGQNSNEQQQEFDNDNIRKNVLGFVAGADFIYRFFVVSGRVGWDFQTNRGDGSSTTPRYKNQWLQLTVGAKI